ncbi:hypothetical protein [Desulfosarcina cetonica]|uniref:hypothetical protein n=1 Tax=Desulfosarcina cetonica TaxID=90730 RepID=UPI0012EEA00F|nr:hypothetical protein [Desulfosarcina cetonica]
MEKITDDSIRQSITTTIMETFDAMAGLPLEVVDEAQPAELDKNRMVGAIHFAGEVVGVMSFQLSEAFSRMLTAACWAWKWMTSKVTKRLKT